MLDALARKGRQLAHDRVLLRWLVLRALRLTPGEPAYTAHRPPYLGAGFAGLGPQSPTIAWAECDGSPPAAPLILALPGAGVTVAPGEEDAVMARAFADTETLLGLHRFAWLRPDSDPRWVAALWRAWARAHGESRQGGWPWHPYTAAERAINLLAWGRRHGLPRGAAPLLAAHGPEIAARLEYFGDHHSSNHLANNGRGLYLLGLGLGLPDCIRTGRAILAEEAGRILAPSGILREGSSHYHLLLTRSYVSVWLAARAAGREDDAALFAPVAARMLAVLPVLALPGGMPLVGDVSPDCPPAALAGLLPGEDLTGGWADWLGEDEKQAVAALAAGAAPVDRDILARDGWVRHDHGDWHGLFHAAPEGFAHMPGHGHQDSSGFTLHWRDVPVIVDPGRGAYGDTGEAAFYRDGGAHSLLQVDGADPFPPNKPYYHPDFRRRVAGKPPAWTRLEDGLRLSHHGFARLSGLGAVEREWRFAADALTIHDRVAGRGTHQVSRRLVTPLEARLVDGGVDLAGPGARFRIEGAGPARLEPVTLWHAYGEGRPGTAITFVADETLPWQGTLILRLAGEGA